MNLSAPFLPAGEIMQRKLTDTAIRKAQPTNKLQKLSDGGGLYLEITKAGTKHWRYRYRIDGKENIFAIGSLKDYTLKQAREAHEEARKLVAQGIHPAQHRKAEKRRQSADRANTFEAVTRAWIAENKPNWAATYERQLRRGFEMYMFDEIGEMPINQIKPADLREPIKKAAEKAATTAQLLHQTCSQIFRYAVLHELAESDPAATLRGLVKRKQVKHHAPLRSDDIPKLLKKIDEYGGYHATKIALKLLLLTFVRSGELRKSKWCEFDLDKALWLIPAERMKMKQDHYVPLSKQAVELLKELQGFTGGREYLFPNLRNPKTFITPTTLNIMLSATL
jgi:integrase